MMTPIEPEGAITLIEMLKQSGPTITFLVGAVFWLNKRADKTDESLRRVEESMDRKLNNGIKAELSETKQRLANIEGQLAVMPRRKTDMEELL